jgi:thymidylate synthase (methanogen type)
MKHIKINAFDCPDAYVKTLRAIEREGIIFKVGYGSEMKETKKINCTIEIEHPEIRPLLHEKSPNDQAYLNWYAGIYLWYPEPDAAEYTYGNRMRKPVDQLQEVIDRFKQEKMDRQCTVVIRRPEDILKGKVKDPPCLTMIDFEIIEDKLCATAYFRSWDAYAGLPCNIAGIQMIAEFMAREIGVESGKLIFHSKNCHIYERQYKLVDELLNIKSTHFDLIKESMKKPQDLNNKVT